MTGDQGRDFLDEDRVRWRATIVSHGRTSDYLAARVHRPLVQFSCLDRPAARRYTALDAATDRPLADLADADLRGLLRRATVH